MPRPTATSTREPVRAPLDTSLLLKNAAEQAAARGFDDVLIIDVDAHHYESEAFREIARFIDDPVMRAEALYQGIGGSGITSDLGNYQPMQGRITRYPLRKTEQTPPGIHRDITLTHRWMDAMGVDYACLFPTPMLALGSCPRVEVEVGLSLAYNRWLCETILAEDTRIKSMLYLPLNAPEACVRTVETFAGRPGVIGFMATTPHYAKVHDNAFVRTYAMLEERGLPLAFHAGFPAGDAALSLTNRFIGLHALGFPWFAMIHMVNWLVNGMPERFPRLKTIWIEAGLAWIPFVMQRLDNEYMMRTSDAPLLKRRPSEYMREMYFSSQPMEMVGNARMLEATFEMINAETQLLYSSDYPHWDMDMPSVIWDLPFLSEQARRNILGGNAQRVFGFDAPLSAPKLARRSP